LQPHHSHQPLHRAAGDLNAFLPHLPPDLARAIDREILSEHTPDLGPENLIPLGSV
jgi:hypothetical protein